MSTAQCFENPPTTSPTSGAGTVQELAGFKTYVTGPPDSKLAILLISDAFGYEAPLFRKLADKVGGAGFLVVAPDFLYGDPADRSNPQFDRDAWIKAHDTDKGYEDAKPVIVALRTKGASAIGVVGFCWELLLPAFMVAVKLASSDDIRTVVLLHPGRITIDEINEVKVPIAILGAELDHIFPAEELKHLGEILSAKSSFECFVKIYPGVPHGWTVRYNVEDESAARSAEEAHEVLLNWITKHVKQSDE